MSDRPGTLPPAWQHQGLEFTPLAVLSVIIGVEVLEKKSARRKSPQSVPAKTAVFFKGQQFTGTILLWAGRSGTD